MLSKQIITKANVIRLVIEDILLDIQDNNTLTIEEHHKQDLNRALQRCDQLIDLGKFCEEKRIQAIEAMNEWS